MNTPITPSYLALQETILPWHGWGELQQFSHPLLRTALWRWLHHKRWFYVTVNHPDYAMAAAVADAGYTGKGFLFVADRRKQAFILNMTLLIPKGMGFGAIHQKQGHITAHARSGHTLNVLLQRQPDGQTTLQAWGPRWQLEVQLQPSEQSSLVAATQLPQAGTNLTQKSVGQPAQIRLITPQQTLDLSANTWGGTDFTDGFVARHTRWYWAYATGQTATGELVSFNLVQGFNGACECCVWIDGEVQAVGEGQFQVPPGHPEGVWNIETTCGTLHLTFNPWAVAKDQGNKGLVRYYFLQAFGTFQGTVKHQDGTELVIEGLTGSTEDQDVWW